MRSEAEVVIIHEHEADDLHSADHLTVYLSCAHEHIRDLYHDAHGKDFMTALEDAATDIGGVVYWHRDEDGDPYLYVQEVTCEQLQTAFRPLYSGLGSVPKLETLVVRKMHSERYKIGAWIHYASQAGSCEALRMQHVWEKCYAGRVR